MTKQMICLQYKELSKLKENDEIFEKFPFLLTNEDSIYNLVGSARLNIEEMKKIRKQIKPPKLPYLLTSGWDINGKYIMNEKISLKEAYDSWVENDTLQIAWKDEDKNEYIFNYNDETKKWENKPIDLSILVDWTMYDHYEPSQRILHNLSKISNVSSISSSKIKM